MTLSASQMFVFRPLVENFLREDFAFRGDLTSDALFGESHHVHALFRAREDGIMAGGALISLVFDILSSHLISPAPLTLTQHIPDGAPFHAGDSLFEAAGPARILLSGERVALNLVSRLCGIATLTHRFVREIQHTSARVTSTRKTTPGLRPFEKYAVTCGGGVNHRFGLHDGVMIKDNHIAFCGGVRPALDKVRALYGPMVPVVVEVDRLDQLEDALDAQAKHILLDNMSPALLAQAVHITSGQAHLEASGGVRLDSVRAIAETGVDTISVGALTHSAPLIDIGFDAQ